MSSIASSPRWPPTPYKGLSFYGPEDVPLFAGREDDVAQCADAVAARETRILILQGATGCGKSSFLRAGLIPFLETDEAGFQFVHGNEGGKYKAIFIRSTDRPLVKLAEAVYDFASTDIEIDTPLGRKSLKLSGVLSPYGSLTGFLKAAVEEPGSLVKVLSAIAAKLPRTLVLVIDQGEEVLTLKPGEEGDPFRHEFFKFVSLFSKSKFDLKLLIALRTEHCGRFIADLKRELPSLNDVPDYFLRELTKEQLIRAIERPTSNQIIPGYGKPYDNYKFSFEAELPEKIVEELKVTGRVGGVLPVMQIVCDNLYSRARAKNGDDPVITTDDYSSLGGLEGQLGHHVEKVLERLCRERRPGKPVGREVEKWKTVLTDLARHQGDGSVTTEILKAEDLRENAARARCKLPFQEVADYLCDDERRILRRTEVVDMVSGKSTHCYSLGHDTIGLVLKRWREEAREAKSQEKRRQLVSVSLAAVSLIIVLGFWWFVPEKEVISQTFGYFIYIPPVLLVLTTILLALTPYYYLERFFSRIFSPFLTILVYLPEPLQRRLDRESLINRNKIVFEVQDDRKARLLLCVMSAIVGSLGILQTQWFVSLFPPPVSDGQMREMMAADRTRQQTLREDYRKRTQREPAQGIVIFPLFADDQLSKLAQARDFLLQDQTLEAELERAYGVSLRDVNALVIPAWHLNSYNQELLGLTPEGWAAVRQSSGGFSYSGSIIRDSRLGRQLTIDGTPRIALNIYAFRSDQTLRLTLFHELLHAMNVPGYYPTRLNFTQSDLTYLPLYRSFVARSGLETKSEAEIRIFLIFLPWIAFLWSAVLIVRRIWIHSDKSATTNARRPRARAATPDRWR